MKNQIMTTKLTVHRRLESGKSVMVGTIAQNNQGVFFQYADDYLSQYHSLSPFKLPFNNEVHLCCENAHKGMFGAFADSLPDGWGTLLMDRIFRQHNIAPYQITQMDRLSYIGDRALGALKYEPYNEFGSNHHEQNNDISLFMLGKEALAVFEGHSNEILQQLANAGSSGGARPKAQIYFDSKTPQQVSTLEKPNLEPWLIKFTSVSLPLKHEEGLCEAAYLTMAKNVGINVPDWLIIPVKSFNWLATKRFDCTPMGGRYHLQSLCSLLDADFRTPSLDYIDLIKAGQMLCNSPVVGQLLFIRALFNLFSANQDDHTKNWAFLQNDKGEWHPSPFYDITFSPSINGEHCTAFCGYGKIPPKKAIQELANKANFNWVQAKQVIEKIVTEIQSFPIIAKDLDISKNTIKMISRYQNDLYISNKALLK